MKSSTFSGRLDGIGARRTNAMPSPESTSRQSSALAASVKRVSYAIKSRSSTSISLSRMSVWSMQTTLVALMCCGANRMQSQASRAERSALPSSERFLKSRSRSCTGFTASVHARCAITPGTPGKSQSTVSRFSATTFTRSPSTPTGLHFAASASTAREGRIPLRPPHPSTATCGAKHPR